MFAWINPLNQTMELDPCLSSISDRNLKGSSWRSWSWRQLVIKLRQIIKWPVKPKVGSCRFWCQWYDIIYIYIIQPLRVPGTLERHRNPKLQQAGRCEGSWSSLSYDRVNGGSCNGGAARAERDDHSCFRLVGNICLRLGLPRHRQTTGSSTVLIFFGI